VLETYPRDVKLVFKNYPPRNHNYAQKAAVAALAAEKQEKFWEFHELLFENSAKLSDQKIKEISEWLDLDWEKFSKDMEDPEIISMITRDKSEGDRAGIEEVPTIFINGRRLKAITWPGVRAVIENELQKLGKQAMSSGPKISTGSIEHVEGVVVK
jgi:protein-disulfide isomerase